MTTTEIISTGEEVLTGAVVDSNSAYIAQQLWEAGVEVVRHTCVGDDMESLVTAFRDAGDRSDIVVVTGGIGPTLDDLTAEAAAKAAMADLMFDERAEKSVKDYFRMKNMSVPVTNRKQMMLPNGATCLENKVGTAPGFFMKNSKGDSTLFFIPGVPSEMRHMLSEHVLPLIKKMDEGQRNIYRVKTISHFGISEVDVNDLLSGLQDVFPGVTLGLRAVFPVIQVKLYANGKDEIKLDRILEDAIRWVLERTGHAVFSTRGLSLVEELARLLVEKKRTVAIAESCTGGLMGHMITSISGSSDYFLFSGVAYSNNAKIAVLGVNPEIINTFGAVSEETVREMAEGTRKISGADFGVATSGIAGPTGGTLEKPVGTVCIGIASGEGVKSFRFVVRFSDREKNKRVFAIKAFDLLRRELMA